MPRALVTGATGLLGSHIVERITAAGWDVRALVRSSSTDLAARNIEAVRGDVLDANSFSTAARGVDVIFHTAAAITSGGGWESYRRLNVDGTAHAIAAAQSSGARLLHVSSVAVYGPDTRYRSASGKTGEDAELGPLPQDAFYARSKRESEQMVMAAHRAGRIWASAVRPDVIYGKRDRQFVPRIARLLRHGVAPLIGRGTSTLAIVQAANVADGVLLAATSDWAGGRAYNLANDFDVSVREFFALGMKGLGKRPHFIALPEWLARGAFAVLRGAARTIGGGTLSVISNASLSMMTEDNPFTSDRARRELNWVPSVRPEVGIPEAFSWWQTNQR